MIQPQDVKQTVARHLLAEGFDVIFDEDKSAGSWLVDKRNGDRYLDFFSMYASMAVGYNHPRLIEARGELGRLAVNKPHPLGHISEQCLVRRRVVEKRGARSA